MANNIIHCYFKIENAFNYSNSPNQMTLLAISYRVCALGFADAKSTKRATYKYVFLNTMAFFFNCHTKCIISLTENASAGVLFINNF